MNLIILSATDRNIQVQALVLHTGMRTVLHRWRCTEDVVLEDSVSDGKYENL